MLGWFLHRRASAEFSATSLDDVEWMLAKCAGFDAGFALVASLDTLQHNGATPAILAAVKNWEAARLAGAFSPGQRERLANPQGEWHLEPAGEEGAWLLSAVQFSKPLKCIPQELQPGQPGGADWPVTNSMQAQPLRFRLHVAADDGGEIHNPSFSIEGYHVMYHVSLQSGQYLVCNGDAEGLVYDRDWNLVQRVPASAPPIVPAGACVASFSCDFAGERPPQAVVTFMAVSEPEMVRKPA